MVEIINTPEGKKKKLRNIDAIPGQANIRVVDNAQRVILRSLVVVEKDTKNPPMERARRGRAIPSNNGS